MITTSAWWEVVQIVSLDLSNEKKYSSCCLGYTGDYIAHLLPRSVTANAPENCWLEDYFFVGKVTCEGQAIKLQNCISNISVISHISEDPIMASNSG